MTSQALNRPVDVLHDMRDGAAKLGAAKQEPAALRLLDAHDAVAELIDALRLGGAVESMFVAMTAEGRIDCRELWAAELCEAFQRFQDARIPALAAIGSAK